MEFVELYIAAILFVLGLAGGTVGGRLSADVALADDGRARLGNT